MSSPSSRNQMMPSFYKAVQNATRRFSLTVGLDRDQPPISVLKSPPSVSDQRPNCNSPNSPFRRSDRSGSVPMYKDDVDNISNNRLSPSTDQVRRVSECDDHFFETFTALQWKLENAKLARLREEGEDSRKSPTLDLSKRTTVKIGQMTRLTKKEMDLLYMEALYTIMHKVGTTTDGHTHFVEDLYTYAKNAFNIDVGEHDKLLAKVSTEKPPILVLNCILIEAKDLEAKDANGFSDPYCMLGIIPNKRREECSSSGRKSPTNSSPLHSPSMPRKLEFPDSDDNDSEKDPKKSNQSLRRKKLGGSFRKKNKEKEKEKIQLPAKVIKASSVQRCSLNPKWNEKFQLDFDSPEDTFHLDIWDHDDEDSVVDAVKKLNEVAGLKGLGRFFKQVAQSARADNDDSVDDFLGCVDITLSNIPSTGNEQWHKLQGRTAKSLVKGSIHLKMWLGTREDRGGEDDDLLDIKQHESLIKIFAEHEIRKSNQEATKWNGQLSQPALTILHQHAIQGDLTDVQQAMCQWLAYSKMHYDTMLDYGFLLKIINNLTSLWVPTSLSKDEEDLLADSFSEFLTHCYDQIVRHRELYNSAEKQISLKRLEDMLRCIRMLHNSALFKKAMPFQKDFLTELPFLIKKSAVGFYEKRKRTTTHEDTDGFVGLIQLLTTLNAGCYRAFHSFNKVFERSTSINYFYITYKQWDRSLQDALCSIMADAVNKHTLTFDLNSKNGDSTLKYDPGLIPALELYLALAEFFSYRQHLTDEEKLKLAPLDYSHWFENAVAKWLSLIKEKFFKRIDLACQIDKKVSNSATKSELKETTSHADVCHCITQIIEFWNYLEFPATPKSADFIVHLVDDLCKGVEYYADKSFSLIAHEGCYDITLPLTDKMIEDVCIAVNNSGHVREMMINFPKSMHFNDFIQRISQSKVDEKIVTKTKNQLDESIEECDKSVTAQLDMALNMLVDRQRETLKKHVFHLAWSPDGCQLEAAIKPLIKQLDVRLVDFHKWLLPHIFIRLLMAQFRAVLQEMKATTIENPGQDANFHKRLLSAIGFLVDYFHASGQGVPKTTIADDKVYKDVTTLLQFNQVPTTTLIQQYYESLWKDQEELKNCKYGFLNVRSYYNAQSSLLVLDSNYLLFVLFFVEYNLFCFILFLFVNAKNIIPLDSNGLSDPFVIVEIVPSPNFTNCKVVKTKIVQKTLNPVFEETFQFPVSQRRPYPGWLHFVVMDHDFLMTNDFAGEAFLKLDEIPGCTSTSERAGTWKSFTVPLLHPDYKTMSAIKVLESRKDDKEALEFLRHLEAIRRT